jgi:hypothetical protein
MTPRIAPQPQPKWRPNWSVIITIASFVFGYGINAFVNYMGYANKVDLLTMEVSQLTTIVGDMNKKLDDGNTRYFSIDKRVSLLEAEQQQPKSK